MAKTTMQMQPNTAALAEELKAALQPLAAIALAGPRVPQGAEPMDCYTLNRCGELAEIKLADIRRARELRIDPEAAIEDLRAALKPLARLPADYHVTDPNASVFAFVDDGGNPVVITNAMIRAARKLTLG